MDDWLHTKTVVVISVSRASSLFHFCKCLHYKKKFPDSLTLASRYWSAVSTGFEITSSPLVTYIFKTFSKHRGTQFWNFLPEIWNIYNQRQLVSFNFERKYKNFTFSHFFQINLTFCVWNWILCVFWGIAHKNITKITNFEHFTHF